MLLADNEGSDDEDCIDDDDDNSSDQNSDLEDGEIEVMNDRKMKAAKKALANADDDCEGIDDSGEYDDDADDMDDESLDENGDQNGSSEGKKKANKEAASDDKNTSGDSTPKQVLPQVNAETKL